MGRLEAKVALIAGGGADGPAKPGEVLSIGNGRATAILSAREGARVMVADLSLKLAQETVDAIRGEGGRAEAVQADVGDEASCRSAVEATVRSFGTLHLLVNNVGIAVGGRLLETTTEQFDKMVDVNLRGHFLMMKYAVPEIAKAGGGAIVNVSSLAALRSNQAVAYETTKAALIALSRSAATSHARSHPRQHYPARADQLLDGAPSDRRPRGAGRAAHSDAPPGDAMGDRIGDRFSAQR
jgi:NAD(P)-dependent dehydrogenase (short-subunit alcohol dehydrogenase family)